MRFFEVKIKNGALGIMSEKEIEKYKDKIDEIRTEFTETEIKEMKIAERELNEKEKINLGLK